MGGADHQFQRRVWAGVRPTCLYALTMNAPSTRRGGRISRKIIGHSASYRCMCYLGADDFECMPVFSPVGGTGQLIDDQVMMQEELLKENIKKGFSILADCYVNQDAIEILRLLLDSGQPVRVRLKAAEMIGDIGPVDAVDALKTPRFGNEKLQEAVQKAVQKIHARHFTRECPFCAEIIKSRAKICKHCGKEVAGE